MGLATGSCCLICTFLCMCRLDVGGCALCLCTAMRCRLVSSLAWMVSPASQERAQAGTHLQSDLPPVACSPQGHWPHRCGHKPAQPELACVAWLSSRSRGVGRMVDSESCFTGTCTGWCAFADPAAARSSPVSPRSALTSESDSQLIASYKCCTPFMRLAEAPAEQPCIGRPSCRPCVALVCSDLRLCSGLQ